LPSAELPEHADTFAAGAEGPRTMPPARRTRRVRPQQQMELPLSA